MLLLFFSTINVSTIAEEERPDLIILEIDQDVMESLNEIEELSELIIPVKIKNIGKGNTSGQSMGIVLKIDGVIISFNETSEVLEKDSTCIINLSWTPNFSFIGPHLLSIMVDYDGIILEEDENNNVWDNYVEIVEKYTDLKLTNLYYSGTSKVDETIKIFAEIKNGGRDTGGEIFAKLNTTEQDQSKEIVMDGGLNRNGTYTFSFNWTPSTFGRKIVGVEIRHDDVVHDYEEMEIDVEASLLPWWNKNWHYRKMVTVEGTGNISLDLNFTRLLNDTLSVTGREFENSTIQVAEYNKNGKVCGVVENFSFFENSSFNAIDNAKGKLIWNISGSQDERYYCIYFDVRDNRGQRNESVENENITESGNATATLKNSDFVGGWWIENFNPANNSYLPIDNEVNITVETVARVENITAEVYFESIFRDTLYLKDIEENVTWNVTYNNLTSAGNWTIKVTAIDDAGYSCETEHSFYVRKPDLKLIGVIFSTNWPPTSPKIYLNDTVTITASIISYNSTINDAVVSILIFDIDGGVPIFYSTTNGRFENDKVTSVEFSWNADKTGKYNVTVFVDPFGSIEELNESNNKLSEEINVNKWPDLAVEEIILPSSEHQEKDDVKIGIIVSNLGDVNATDYEIRLYIEPKSQNVMKYENCVDNDIVTIGNNSNKTVGLHWNSAKPGEWLVGAKILVADTKKDTNIDNNRMFYNGTLKIRSVEKNKPDISSMTALPSNQEQGAVITITADITDDSGLEYVHIKVISPSNEVYTANMTRIDGDCFKFDFEDTFEIGIYDFTIEATDISVHLNKAEKSGTFEIYEDSTDPEISYFDAAPSIQMIDNYVEISCIATDNIGMKTLKVIVASPSKTKVTKYMAYSSEGKYVYEDIYNITGKYSFYVRATDLAGNYYTTDSKFFWVTEDVNDTDNDGMPDWWEEKYGLDPKNPSDAEEDKDGDGISNIRECQLGNNPSRDILMQNMAPRIKDNTLLIFVSIFLFILIIFVSKYGQRGRLI